MMNLNAKNRVKNIDAKFANTLILLIKFSFITRLLSQAIITVILLTLCIKFIAENAQKHNILEKQAEISDTDLIITHTIRQKKTFSSAIAFQCR